MRRTTAIHRGPDSRVADVLIIGTSIDSHISAVVAHLDAKLVVCRFDIDRFPIDSTLTLSYKSGRLFSNVQIANGSSFEFTPATTVWFRRIGAPTIAPEIQEPKHRLFASGEVEDALSGFVASLDDAIWVNRFASTRRASNKPLQLATAAECGFKVPRSLITNDVDAARAFLANEETSLYKTMHSPCIEYPDGRKLIFTSVIEREAIARISLVKFAPCLFQEYIPKAYELRVTIVGANVFPVKIDSQAVPEASVDWRAVGYERLRHELIEIPDEVKDKLLALMRALNLDYGAVDMIVTPQGEYVFLEVNPHGAWLWLEHATGAPISRTLASLLSP